MKRNITLIVTIAIVILSGGLSACDSTVSGPPEASEMEMTAASQIRSATVVPVQPQTDPPTYVLTVTIEPDPERLVLPTTINVLGQGPELPNTTISDTGLGTDLKAGDGVFSGIIPLECIEETSDDISSSHKISDVKCKIDIVAPGSDCGTFGKCPERVHRSFLWGLIEYDTDVVLCFCLVECEFGK